MQSPRVTDNDADTITVTDEISGKVLRSWWYADDYERRFKMILAREYVEGYHDGREYVWQRHPAAYIKDLHARDRERKEIEKK